MKKLKLDKDLKTIIRYMIIGVTLFTLVIFAIAKKAEAFEINLGGAKPYVLCGMKDKQYYQGKEFCAIQLPSNIGSVDDYAQAVQAMYMHDTVIYLTGYGGQVDTVQLLLSTMKNTSKRVTTVVTGSIRSGHAYIAFATKNVRVLDNFIVMFHSNSIVDMDCGSNYTEEHKDRGKSTLRKCQAFKVTVEAQFMLWLDTHYTGLFTEEEMNWIKEGYDVSFWSGDLANRVQTGKKETSPFTAYTIGIQMAPFPKPEPESEPTTTEGE